MLERAGVYGKEGNDFLKNDCEARIWCLFQTYFVLFKEKKHITELFHMLINNLVNETSEVSACIKYNIKQDGTLISIKVKLRLSENVSFIDNGGFAF